MVLGRGTCLDLYRHGDGASTTQAECCQAPATPTAAQLIDERDENTGTAGADGMAEGDSATVNVHARPVPVKFLAVRQGLRGKGFIDFDQVKVVDLQTSTLQQAIDGARELGLDGGNLSEGSGGGGLAGVKSSNGCGHESL